MTSACIMTVIIGVLWISIAVAIPVINNNIMLNKLIKRGGFRGIRRRYERWAIFFDIVVEIFFAAIFIISLYYLWRVLK